MAAIILCKLLWLIVKRKFFLKIRGKKDKREAQIKHMRATQCLHKKENVATLKSVTQCSVPISSLEGRTDLQMYPIFLKCQTSLAC